MTFLDRAIYTQCLKTWIKKPLGFENKSIVKILVCSAFQRIWYSVVKKMWNEDPLNLKPLFVENRTRSEYCHTEIFFTERLFSTKKKDFVVLNEVLFYNQSIMIICLSPLILFYYVNLSSWFISDLWQMF